MKKAMTKEMQQMAGAMVELVQIVAHEPPEEIKEHQTACVQHGGALVFVAIGEKADKANAALEAAGIFDDDEEAPTEETEVH